MKPVSKKQKPCMGRRPRIGNNDGNTRAAILAAARAVFSERGLEGATVRQVAEAARVNNAMIYYHFRDKIELYRAVLSDSFAAFDRIWEHEIFSTKASARVKIHKYIEELIRFQHSNEELRRILSMELACCRRDFKWLGENLFNPSYRKLVKILSEGMKQGELKKMEPSQAIAALVGIVIHSFILKPVAEYVSGKQMNLSVKQFGEFVTGMFFDGLGMTPSRQELNRVKKTGRKVRV